MSRICDTCKRSDVCRKPIGGIESCRLYVSGRESNYKKLFGTPERAARTLENAQLEVWDYCAMVDSRCDECRYEFDRYGCCDPTPLLEWLRGDA